MGSSIYFISISLMGSAFMLSCHLVPELYSMGINRLLMSAHSIFGACRIEW